MKSRVSIVIRGARNYVWQGHRATHSTARYQSRLAFSTVFGGVELKYLQPCDTDMYDNMTDTPTCIYVQLYCRTSPHFAFEMHCRNPAYHGDTRSAAEEDIIENYWMRKENARQMFTLLLFYATLCSFNRTNVGIIKCRFFVVTLQPL